ncbi:DUF58 domain-containing protein [Undibacterium sp. Di24W]|uniref:DUF58 domain-containing protein n=1 Tax=Undibacterium sp. Di24W TaxID=3413033 RepID=UPI003BF0C43C
MNLINQLKLKWRSVVFLEKRPEVGEIVLKQRRVFTLPSKPGLFFFGMLVLLFLASTNYNLNLGFAMTYLLTGLAAINALFTFRNLAYLRLNAGTCSPIFAGDVAEFPIHIKNTQNLARYALHFSFVTSNTVGHIVDINPQENLLLRLQVQSKHRGYLAIPRIRIQTWFPLGLLRAWSTWLPDAKALVYPTPEISSPALPLSLSDDGTGLHSNGDEDFAGVRSYQLGDPLKHLSWKHIARIDVDTGGSLVTKLFSGGAQGEVILDFAALSTQLDVELRLSRMTAWILDAERQGLAYGFKLDHIDYPPALNEEHRAACLRALALYGLDEKSDVRS